MNSTLNFRPARVDDHEQVVSLTETIWDGEDYLPHVWHEWVESPRGRLIVGTLDNDIVVIGRAVELTPGGWWLEGMRVHPDHQGKGYASTLHYYLLRLALQQPGAQTVGLATSSENPQIAHLALKSGMTLYGDYRFFKGRALNEPASGARQVPPNVQAELWQRLERGTWLTQTRGFAMDGWVARPMDSAWLEQIMASGGAWQWGDAVALIGQGAHSSQWWIHLLDEGTEAEQAQLVRHARHLLFLNQPESYLRCFAPLDDSLHRALIAGGLNDPDDGEFHIFHFVREVTEALPESNPE